MEKPGCRWAVTLVSLMFAAGFLLGRPTCGQNGPSSENNVQLGSTIGTVADIPIYDGMIQQDASSQGQINATTTTPAQYATAYGRALDKEVTQALLLVIAKKKGISIDEDTVKKAAATQFDQNQTFQKEMLALQNKIPQNATDQQLDAYYKSQGQPTIEKQRQDIVNGYASAYEDPNRKTLVERAIANDLVMSAIESSINITDDELKHSQDQYVTKAIYFYSAKHPGMNIQKEAEQVLADLRAKKITFDDAMDKYTDQPPAAGKKPHDNTNLVSMGTLKSDPNYKPLLGMKPGDISDVLPNPPQGVAIYQLSSIQSQPIPNFDKQKDTLRKNELEQEGATELQSELKAARANTPTKWSSPGAGVLYDWYEATQADNNFNAKPVADQHKVDQGFVDKGLAAGDSYGLLAAAGAIDPLWTSATATEKKALTDKYLQILQNVLQSYASYPGCMQLIQMASEEKNKTLIYQGLAQATQINEQNLDSQGLENFHDLAADLEKYQSEGLLTSDQAASIRKYLDSWKSDKAQYDEGQLKQQQELAKEKAEEDAKRKAEAAKQKVAPAAPTAPLLAPNAAPKSAPPTPLLNPGGPAAKSSAPTGKASSPVKPAAGTTAPAVGKG